MTNLQVNENVPKAEALLRRAAKAGYNGVLLADYKLNVLERVPDHYFTNTRQFKAAADEVGAGFDGQFAGADVAVDAGHVIRARRVARHRPRSGHHLHRRISSTKEQYQTFPNMDENY